MFFHVFAQTTHVVAAPHGFACVVIPAARLYIPSVIEIRSGVLEPQGVKIWPFPLLWLFAFTTACSTVQAVIPVVYRWIGELLCGLIEYLWCTTVCCTGGIRGDDRAGVDLEIIPDPRFRRLKATVDIALAVKLYYTSQ